VHLPSLGALTERRFRLLWTGQALSAIGDAMLPVALAFAVLELTGSYSDLGLVLAAALGPRVLLLLVGGVWADRLPRQLVMLASDVVRALAQAFVATVFLLDVAELWHLLVAGFVYGVAQAFFLPASTALIPETVSPARLQQANALMTLTRSALFVGGPALGGLLVSAFGPGWVFAIDSATFMVSAMFLAFLGVRGAVVERHPFLADLRAGWREVKTRSWVWASLLFFCVWNFASAPFYVLGPFIVADELGGASNWGIILAGSGLGSIVGGVIALRLRPNRPLVAAYALCLATALPPLSLIGPLPTLAIAAATFLSLAATTLGNTLWVTTLQERIPRTSLSRVSAYEWAVSLVFLPVGYAVAGPLADLLGADATLAIAGGMLAVATLAVLSVAGVRGVRRTEHEPHQAPPSPSPAS
jgi:MFS family permease